MAGGRAAFGASLRGAGTLGLVATAFGLASRQVLGEWSAYNVTNLVVGGGLCALGAAAALARAARRTSPAERGPSVEALLVAVSITWAAVLVQVAVSLWGPRFDWTFERRFALAPATVEAVRRLGENGPVELTLYGSAGDPRLRATRLLLEQIAAAHPAAHSAVRDLDASPEDEDRYGIGSSNSVVITHARAWRLVERPSEGALYEALAQLRDPTDRVVYITAGTGEGDPRRSEDAGFSGLRAALETEGYRVRGLLTAVRPEVPEDADALIVIAPERRLTDAALAGLRRYLDERGGRLVALLEPGRESGVEDILADYGLASPDAVVVDPPSGRVEGDGRGLDPIVSAYADHPVTRELDSNRMTFFRLARGFELRKPRPDDRVSGAVYSSAEAWLHADPAGLNRRLDPEAPAGMRGDYRPLVVAGEYRRAERTVRIVAFGDSTFASNRYLRALFNLDLVLNAVHWVTEREPEITIRPKSGALLQFPVPVQSALNALYGIGLLVPQATVMIGAWVYIRRRSA